METLTGQKPSTISNDALYLVTVDTASILQF